MIGIIDYGLGNISAFENIYRSNHIKTKRIKTKEDFEGITHIILPGVGAFDKAISLLKNSGLIEDLNCLVLKERIPILGICVGMQIMANRSDEGKLDGLGWIPGHVKKFTHELFNNETYIPHMGWNDLKIKKNNYIFEGLDSPKFYFLHSYFFEPKNEENIIGSTSYGIDFPSILNSENIFAAQFHPEKSHHFGERILLNFSKTLC